MAILGKDPEGYNQYAGQIRQEYIHVPDHIYNTARPSVLEKLSSGGIYVTDEFKELFEEKAKQNMRAEIQRLRQNARIE